MLNTKRCLFKNENYDEIDNREKFRPRIRNILKCLYQAIL